LEINTTEAKTGETKIHTTHKKISLQIIFSLNNDSKITRAPLLGKCPIDTNTTNLETLDLKKAFVGST
jgi:hypothetical protein